MLYDFKKAFLVKLSIWIQANNMLKAIQLYKSQIKIKALQKFPDEISRRDARKHTK